MTAREEVFTMSTRIGRPAAGVFAWHERPGALRRLCPPWEKIEIWSAQGGIRDGGRAVVRAKVGWFWSTWEMEHRDYLEGKQFRDVMRSGPFAKWEHLHTITPSGPDACVLTDTITYGLPLGAIGQAVAGAFTRHKLVRMFTWRHAVTRTDLENVALDGNPRPLRIVLAGGSGLIGGALTSFLQTQGHEVICLVRGRTAGLGEVRWEPSRGEIDAVKLEGVDAVINLAGENVAGGRWTPARRERILRSRVEATRTLVNAIGQLQRKPSVFINAAAAGFYGERGETLLTEASGIGQGFLAGVCLAWETHAEAAARLGIRTAWMRFGVVLSPQGGALAKMLPVFRAGLGGRFGAGRQWMSWISIDDAVGAIYHALMDPSCVGPYNVVAPEPVRNAEFVAVLARVLRRPAAIPVPATALRFVFGEMAEETLLASTRVVPEKLQAAGYRFRHPDLESALRHVLGRMGKV